MSTTGTTRYVPRTLDWAGFESCRNRVKVGGGRSTRTPCTSQSSCGHVLEVPYVVAPRSRRRSANGLVRHTIRCGEGGMAIPEVLLFDLGGVLVESAGLQELPRLLAAPMEAEALRRKWLTSPAVGLFETGRCSEQEFAAVFIEDHFNGSWPRRARQLWTLLCCWFQQPAI